MAMVTIDALNKRQLKTLTERNDAWRHEGLIPNDVEFYHYCNRCEELGIGVRFQPIENFNFHGSRADGVSGYCTKCINSGLNKTEAEQALSLMNTALVPSHDGELVIQDLDGTWKRASEIDNVKEVLASNLEKETQETKTPEVEVVAERKRFPGKTLMLLVTGVIGCLIWRMSVG